MSVSKCDRCAFRARYDRDPASLLGRLWRWHTNWCPGWKAHMRALPPEERGCLAARYGMTRRW
jgi:hypothetical protein